MMDLPKVSVIVPLYNTEKYVIAAIESILEQTLEEIEIIVIDDGSTDDSLRRVARIAAQDTRIRLFTKKNEGPSEARNMGLEIAKGQYIYYMDSDDLLERDALKVCYERCEKNDLDFVFFDATAFKEDLSESLNDYYTRSAILKEETIYTGVEVLSLLMDVNLYRSAVWLCFVRRQYLDNINLRFFPRIIHEDELYSGILHIQAKRVEYVAQPFFRRRIRPHSITSNKFSTKNMVCYYVVISELRKYANRENGKHKPIIDKLCAYILNPAIYRASAFSLHERLDQLQYCINTGLMKYVTSKNKLLLLFPFLIKAKTLLK